MKRKHAEAPEAPQAEAVHAAPQEEAHAEDPKDPAPLPRFAVEALPFTGLVAVIGPAGSGKSMVASRIADSMAARGRRVLRDVCLEELETLQEMLASAAPAASAAAPAAAEPAAGSDALFLTLADISPAELRTAAGRCGLLDLLLNGRRYDVGAVVPMDMPTHIAPAMRPCFDVVMVACAASVGAADLERLWKQAGFDFLPLSEFAALYRRHAASAPDTFLVLDRRTPPGEPPSLALFGRKAPGAPDAQDPSPGAGAKRQRV